MTDDQKKRRMQREFQKNCIWWHSIRPCDLYQKMAQRKWVMVAIRKIWRSTWNVLAIAEDGTKKMREGCRLNREEEHLWLKIRKPKTLNLEDLTKHKTRDWRYGSRKVGFPFHYDTSDNCNPEDLKKHMKILVGQKMIFSCFLWFNKFQRGRFEEENENMGQEQEDFHLLSVILSLATLVLLLIMIVLIKIAKQ